MSEEFYSGDYRTNSTKTALVLIQSTGSKSYIRAGEWAKYLCVIEDFHQGSMLPQVDWAVSKGIPILIMNPNYDVDPATKEPIPRSRSMYQHTLNVWDTYVKNSGFAKIHIMAFSGAGYCIYKIQGVHGDSFYSQVGKIAFTNSNLYTADVLADD